MGECKVGKPERLQSAVGMSASHLSSADVRDLSSAVSSDGSEAIQQYWSAEDPPAMSTWTTSKGFPTRRNVQASQRNPTDKELELPAFKRLEKFCTDAVKEYMFQRTGKRMNFAVNMRKWMWSDMGNVARDQCGPAQALHADTPHAKSIVAVVALDGPGASSSTAFLKAPYRANGILLGSGYEYAWLSAGLTSVENAKRRVLVFPSDLVHAKPVCSWRFSYYTIMTPIDAGVSLHVCTDQRPICNLEYAIKHLEEDEDQVKAFLRAVPDPLWSAYRSQRAPYLSYFDAQEQKALMDRYKVNVREAYRRGARTYFKPRKLDVRGKRGH